MKYIKGNIVIQIKNSYNGIINKKDPLEETITINPIIINISYQLPHLSIGIKYVLKTIFQTRLKRF